MCKKPVVDRFSAAAIAAAAEELLDDPDEYFARRRALHAKEAKRIVEQEINARLAARRARSPRWLRWWA